MSPMFVVLPGTTATYLLDEALATALAIRPRPGMSARSAFPLMNGTIARTALGPTQSRAEVRREARQELGGRRRRGEYCRGSGRRMRATRSVVSALDRAGLRRRAPEV